MDTIIQYISTFLTIYLTDIFKTENRVLDSVTVGIFSLLIIQPLTYLFKNWKKVYNCLIYHLYGMKNHPLEIWRAPYLYTMVLSKEAFEKSFQRYSPHTYLNNSMFHLYDTCLPKVVASLLQKSKMGIVLCDDGLPLLPSRGFHDYKPTNMTENGIYLISIDKFGNPIYYCSNSHIFYQDRDGYMDFEGHFRRYYSDECQKLKSETNSPNSIYIVKFNIPEGSNSKSYILQKTSDISRKKTFNTLFYTQKYELMNILNKFKTETMYPAHIPMENKLGILLYGPPGTGKTGTISAIANYLQRNITMVNFAEISTTEDLDLILDPERYKETIFVFDEFDCLLDVLGKKVENDKPEKTDWATMLMVADSDEKKKIMDMMRSGRKAAKQNLNLAYLLQKLDGLESAEGRIIIATTNNPDKINPALLRPGRFDLKLCLGNCTQDMYGKILESFYRNEKEVYRRVLKSNIPDMKYSPLELMNLAMQNETLNKLLEKISPNKLK